MEQQILTVKDWALILFLGALVLTLTGLVIDYGLEARGFETITQLTRRKWWIGLLPMTVIGTLPVSMLIHLYWPD